MPCGWSCGRGMVIRSTTLTTRTLSPGSRSFKIWAAATVSIVTTSPAQASTMSGSVLPSSLPAQSQIPAPSAQCLIASSMVSHCCWGCLSITIRFTYERERKQWSATDSSVLASGGR